MDAIISGLIIEIRTALLSQQYRKAEELAKALAIIADWRP